MAEQRERSMLILLTTAAKSVSVELFDAREWPEKSCNDGEFRVRVDGKWHSPTGKYTFLPHASVMDLISGIMAGKEPLGEDAAPGFKVGQVVTVHFGDCVGSVPVRSQRGFVTAPPFRGVDGRWYVAVSTFDGTEHHLCHDVVPVDKRKAA